jgi:sulfane dehydrogenase subunit SoxC
MSAKRSGRRRFLKDGAALAGLAVGSVGLAKGQSAGEVSEPQVNPGSKIFAYGERSRFVTSVRGPLPKLLTPIGETMGIITPNSLHFVQGAGAGAAGPIPDIDPEQHRLMIHGMVDRPLIFTMEELKRFPSASRIHFLQCAGGSAGERYGAMRMEIFSKNTGIIQYWKTSCAEWTGVLLSVLLREVGVQEGASWLVAEGADWVKHTRSLPLAKAMDDVLVAYGQNGEPVRREQGYPLRLVVPGWEGNVNIKWLRRIKVVDQPYMTVQESDGYALARGDGKSRWFLFEMAPQSVITFPSGGQRLPGPGFYEITGLAWSGGGAIRKVEVSTDGGRGWMDAALQEPVLRYAHARFRFPWKWDGKEVVVASRCTDEKGQVQPTLAELGKIWGVSSDYWLSTTNKIGHFNPIQPWRVTPEGSVYNALFY